MTISERSSEFRLYHRDPPVEIFPDYIDYLPKGCIVRKIGVMGYLPEYDKDASYIAISQDEYANFVEETTQLVVKQFIEKKLV